MDAIRDFIEREDPGAVVAPSGLPGFTDSRWFREAFPDCVAYGFMPARAFDLFEAAPLIHGADERVPVEDLGHGRPVLRRAGARDTGMMTRGEAPPRRHGAAQRAAGARPDALGGRGAHAGRRDQGRVGPQAAARRRARSSACPALRGVAKLAEAMAVIPLVKSALPEAKLPMQDARTLGAMGAVVADRARDPPRRARARTAGREAAVALLSVAPGAARAAPGRAGRRGTASSTSRSPPTSRTARPQRRGEGARPLRLAPGRADAVDDGRRHAWPRAGRACKGPAVDGAIALGSMAVAVEIFGWSERHSGSALARALRRPGHELQRAVGTREPDEAQLEVGPPRDGGDPASGRRGRWLRLVPEEG